MRKEIIETLNFMERLREAFPCDKRKDPFGDYVRCDVVEAARKLDMPIEEIWHYVSAACNAHLIDNNGGKLRFNNSLYEDMVEMVLLDAFKKAEDKVRDISIGFVFKVIRNMYRDDNYCAGKLADFHRKSSIPIEDVFGAILRVANNDNEDLEMEV